MERKQGRKRTYEQAFPEETRQQRTTKRKKQTSEAAEECYYRSQVCDPSKIEKQQRTFDVLIINSFSEEEQTYLRELHFKSKIFIFKISEKFQLYRCLCSRG